MTVASSKRPVECAHPHGVRCGGCGDWVCLTCNVGCQKCAEPTRPVELCTCGHPRDWHEGEPGENLECSPPDLGHCPCLDFNPTRPIEPKGDE